MNKALAIHHERIRQKERACLGMFIMVCVLMTAPWMGFAVLRAIGIA